MTVTLTAAAGFAAGALTMVLVLVIFRDPFRARCLRTGERIDGAWHGWSVFLPVDGFFFEDHEAIYRLDVIFHQRGRYVSMYEEITRIHGIDGVKLEHIPTRRFTGRGRFHGPMDAVLGFTDSAATTSGVMYLSLDAQREEIYAMLVVRPRKNGRPVAVKMVLRQKQAPMPLLEEMGIDRIRRLSTPE